MALRADEMIDRRQLRRKLTFWRVLAFAVAAIAVVGAAVMWFDGEIGARAVDHIAKVRIEGTITEDEELMERLTKLRETAAVKGVILSIDSPGGTTAGGEAIFDEVRRLAAAKPVVAQVGTLAASAGYMIASATDHIVARKSSILGSIGVLVQFPNISGLMDKLGVTLDEIKSSPLKAEPSPFNPTTEPERAMMRAMVLDSYDWFVGLVDERRPLSRAEVVALADGSVFTGRQALQRKLVDSLGGELEAVKWLESKGVAPKLEVVEWEPERRGSSFLFGKAMARLGSLFGIGASDGNILSEIGADRIFLDGLVSVWQPDTSSSHAK
ncbi:MAG TPA: signal peptide peptidase SppA [Mesorhizobium sp.]|jgi:protease IV